MNAKKIMSAVLVALLAAALFVGAGAAANNGTVFLYQNFTTTEIGPSGQLNGTWMNGEYSFTLNTNNPYVSNEALPDGKYFKNGDEDNGDYIFLMKPTGTVGAKLSDGTSVIGGTVFTGDEITFSVNVPANVGGTYAFDSTNVKLLFTNPDGIKTEQFNGTFDTDWTEEAGEVQEGTWKVQVLFSKGNGPAALANGTPQKYLFGADVFTFNVIKADKYQISADVESVIVGNNVVITITGKPGDVFLKNSSEVEIIPGQFGVDNAFTSTSYTKVNIGNSGVATVALKAKATGDLTLGVYTSTSSDDLQNEVDIEVTEGEINVNADAISSYYIGTDIKLTGTNTVGGTLYFYIEGTNYDFKQLNGVTATTKNDKTWETTIKGDDIRKMKLDAGTYTIYIGTAVNAGTNKNAVKADGESYTTVSVALKQPFITVTDAPDVVVQKTELKIVGTAEATKQIAYYIFGTNKFYYANDTVNASTISVKDNIYTIKLDLEKVTFADGQYFMVIQHPMYDDEFNVWAESNQDIMSAPTEGNAASYKLGKASVVFNVKDRQTANAAQALCDELDKQSIDDMYVKISFIIAPGESTINPIPSEITKGSKLTVSGQTNGGAGTLVTVEMMSTAFAAVPKETVGSASFISLTTKTDADGNWEVTFDTTGLNVDEYTVAATVEGFGTSSPAKINVIEGAPTEQPTENPTEQPTQTEQPTTPPTTPGFGALAALAGLGAVAVLLLRRE